MIDARLDVPLQTDDKLDACGPLADGRVVPIDFTDVAGRGTAERQVLEVAAEGGKVLTNRQSTDFPIQTAADEHLIEPEVGEVPGLSSTIHILYFLKRAEVRLVVEVISVAIRDRYLKVRTVPREQFLQINSGAHAPLVDVPDLLTRAPARIGRDLRGIAAGQIDTGAGQIGPRAAPVAGQHRGLPGSRRTREERQDQRRVSCTRDGHGSENYSRFGVISVRYRA